ncbi:Hypothetical_protein [Hexamita inflata]|uniref:Hypothetical_protein n=1 Tax=Hexamita inflata TaxID=28002 RepID=A0AA86PND2_9EUKA|nr:Hypothetical protein HINF_LOCUS25822 [Hexamita inflata]
MIVWSVLTNILVADKQFEQSEIEFRLFITRPIHMWSVCISASTIYNIENQHSKWKNGICRKQTCLRMHLTCSQDPQRTKVNLQKIIKIYKGRTCVSINHKFPKRVFYQPSSTYLFIAFRCIVGLLLLSESCYQQINDLQLIHQNKRFEEITLYITCQFISTDRKCKSYKIIQLSQNKPKQEETDQRVMTLFPALNLEALRVAADTLVPIVIPAIPKIAAKITSEVNNVSSSAELTQVV